MRQQASRHRCDRSIARAASADAADAARAIA
jgi:hypothetical protein